jgi:hypothetical protein
MKTLLTTAALALLCAPAMADDLDWSGFGGGALSIINGGGATSSIAGGGGISHSEQSAGQFAGFYQRVELVELDSDVGADVTEMDGFEITVISDGLLEGFSTSQTWGAGDSAWGSASNAGAISSVWGWTGSGDADW